MSSATSDRARSSIQRRGRARLLIPLPGGAASQTWLYILPLFLAGSVTTAVGVTIAESDQVILVGMVLTGMAVVAMWLPGKGLNLMTLGVMAAFVGGSGLTALALTVNPSNAFFLWGMILSGAGIVGMWFIGKEGRLAQGTAACFLGGTALQAVGLTVSPSDTLVMAGMVGVSVAVFGMWLYSNRSG